MPDDFFSGVLPGRSLLRDTFKIDVSETDSQHLVEAELPGIKKEEIKLNLENEILCISVIREKTTEQHDKAYVHKERRTSSMSRNIRLVNAKPDEIKAKLEHGVLTVIVPKQEKVSNSHRIDIE